MIEIKNEITKIIVNKLGIDEKNVTESSQFTNDLGADSLDTVELIMEFERVFGIEIPDSETEKMSTVADAIRFVEERVAKAA